MSLGEMPPISRSEMSTLPLVAIGASTGGPQALRAILTGWPKDFPAAVLIAQHIGPDFADSLTAWLSDGCKLAVRTARDGDRPQPGVVLIAGTDDHLVLRGRYSSVCQGTGGEPLSSVRGRALPQSCPALAPAIGCRAANGHRAGRGEGDVRTPPRGLAYDRPGRENQRGLRHAAGRRSTWRGPWKFFPWTKSPPPFFATCAVILFTCPRLACGNLGS